MASSKRENVTEVQERVEKKTSELGKEIVVLGQEDVTEVADDDTWKMASPNKIGRSPEAKSQKDLISTPSRYYVLQEDADPSALGKRNLHIFLEC